MFLDLRDRTGLIQLSCDPDWTAPEDLVAAAGASPETVLSVEGEVVRRAEPARDVTMPTREVEVRVSRLRVVGPAVTPAILVARREGEELAAEELRLEHRVLDLRRSELQRNLILRHRLLQRARRTLTDLGFLEIETPILTTPTPEGARDYLVPSRVHPGEFYALPQSPQLYKQLLMIAGFDRYFQLARCFRDEDLRADRQPEFTQIDIEASFVTQADVLPLVERVLVDLWAEAGYEVTAPFVRLSHHDAMERFGVDKPDLRYDLEIDDITPLLSGDVAPFVREAVASGGRVRALVAPLAAALSRKDLDQLAAAAKAAGGGGLIWARHADAGWEGQGVKALSVATLERIGAPVGSVCLAVAGADRNTSAALHAVRTALVQRPDVAPRSAHAFAWVVDFPLFEHDPASDTWVFTHHPFTSPHPDDLSRLGDEPWRCRALHYDAVYNGNELGSGSIRITDAALQSTVFRLLGISAEEQRKRFGFLLDALASGAPPHGGFALGFDRIAMLLAGGGSLRDVIAFPKTAAARALLEGAPVAVAPRDLAALHLHVTVE